MVQRLPRGAGLVYRPFGAKDALEEGRRLVRLARRRGLAVLVGADAGLAARLMADGVHMPQRLAGRITGLRRTHPRWRITCAAHSASAIAAARRFGADAVFVSAVFASRSASAGRPMGALRFAALAHGARIGVYALGGVDAKSARMLARSGAAGLAAVEGLAGGDRNALQHLASGQSDQTDPSDRIAL